MYKKLPIRNPFVLQLNRLTLKIGILSDDLELLNKKEKMQDFFEVRCAVMESDKAIFLSSGCMSFFEVNIMCNYYLDSLERYIHGRYRGISYFEHIHRDDFMKLAIVGWDDEPVVEFNTFLNTGTSKSPRHIGACSKIDIEDLKTFFSDISRAVEDHCGV